MIATRPICSRCASRRSVLQLATAASATPHPRLSAFYSTSSSSSSSDAAGSPVPPPRGPRLDASSRHSRSSPVSSQESLDNAVALFNQVVNPSRRDLEPEEGGDEAQSVAEWEVAGKLRVMEEKQSQYGPAERLHAFRTEVMPYFNSLKGKAPKHVFMSATNYLSQIASEVVRKGLLGYSVALSDMLAGIGNWELAIRNALVLNLCYTLIGTKDPKTNQNAPQALVELIDMWKHLSQLGRASQVGQPLAFTLPTTEELQDRLYAMQHKAEKKLKNSGPDEKWNGLQPKQALALPFQTGSAKTAHRLVSGLLASLVVLRDRRIVGPKIPVESEPLLKAVATVLHYVELQTEEVSRVLSSPAIRMPQNKLQRVRFYVKGQWSQVLASMLSKEESWSDTILPTSSRSGGSYLADVVKKLRAAHKSRNVGAVVALWEGFKTKLGKTPELMDQVRDDPEFMDFWIYVWSSLGRDLYLQEMVGVMNDMGVEPTVKSYTAMMHGWKASRNTSKIDGLWSMLAESNFKLDSHIWVERISAYVEAGKPQLAIDALGEMMRLWKKAVDSKDEENAIKPSIEVINATLKALLRHDTAAAHEVLDWASKEGIEPNVFTYNMLIQACFRNKEQGSVPELLRAMKEQDIDLDTSSFTIILEEVLRGMHSSSADDQVQAVDQILKDMLVAGVAPNQEIYGKMLHAISGLRDGGADEAIEAVQAHARHRRVSMSPYMITILIERIVRRTSPPDMTAVEALLADHGITRVRTDGDQTLWERVMAGHALAGNATSAMTIFRELRRSGRPVTTLACLGDLVRGLLDAEQVQAARSVVAATVKAKMEGDALMTGSERYWKHHFWFEAYDKDLLSGLELPRDLMKTLGKV